MRRLQFTMLLLLLTMNLFGQCAYLSDISGDDNTTVIISIIPSSIIVNSESCQNGYNFDIEFNYEITAYQNENPLSDYPFYTLQGNFVTNEGTLFFNLPNEVSRGVEQTAGNAWNGSGVDDCSSITLSDISITDIEIQIHNEDIPEQTITMNCENYLPIELLYFSSLEEGRKVQLNWATASEHNNDYFRLEKSYNGDSWSFLGQIKGNGNSSSENNYHYIDSFPKLGINYYRLTQFDYDGKSEVFGDYIFQVIR